MVFDVHVKLLCLDTQQGNIYFFPWNAIKTITLVYLGLILEEVYDSNVPRDL